MASALEIFSTSEQLDVLLLFGAVQEYMPMIFRLDKLMQPMMRWSIILCAETNFFATIKLKPLGKAYVVEQRILAESVQPCVGVTELNLGPWAWC